MPQTIKRLGAAAACAVAVGLMPAALSVAHAQSNHGADKPASQGYRPYAGIEPGSWIEANDRAGRIGGCPTIW